MSVKMIFFNSHLLSSDDMVTDETIAFFTHTPYHPLFIKWCFDKVYKKGFKDGLEACKPNKKLDELIKQGIEVKEK